MSMRLCNKDKVIMDVSYYYSIYYFIGNMHVKYFISIKYVILGPKMQSFKVWFKDKLEVGRTRNTLSFNISTQTDTPIQCFPPKRTFYPSSMCIDTKIKAFLSEKQVFMPPLKVSDFNNRGVCLQTFL